MLLPAKRVMVIDVFVLREGYIGDRQYQTVSLLLEWAAD